MSWQACVDCGEVTQGPRCDLHKLKPAPKSQSTTERGYDNAWRRLSERARALQPWCIDCHSTEHLQADHLPIAWERKAKGLPVRLIDIQVLCGDCNIKAGSARPGQTKRTD